MVFTRRGESVLYLLECSYEGYWGFPKGHVEAGEGEEETALREIKEETGLDVRILPGFRQVDEHPLLREGRPDVTKQTVYFLAEYENQSFRAQESEIAELKLMDGGTAMETLQFDGVKRVLREAILYLQG